MCNITIDILLSFWVTVGDPSLNQGLKLPSLLWHSHWKRRRTDLKNSTGIRLQDPDCLRYFPLYFYRRKLQNNIKYPGLFLSFYHSVSSWAGQASHNELLRKTECCFAAPYKTAGVYFPAKTSALLNFWDFVKKSVATEKELRKVLLVCVAQFLCFKQNKLSVDFCITPVVVFFWSCIALFPLFLPDSGGMLDRPCTLTGSPENIEWVLPTTDDRE